MKKIYIKDIKTYVNQEISLAAFVENIRILQYVVFIVLTDNTGKIQVTIERNEENEYLVKEAEKLTIYSTIKVVGKVLENEKVKLGGMEIIPSKIEITSLADNNFPIDIKDINKSLLETRLDNRFLDLRNERNYLIFKIQTTVLEAMRKYWSDNDYIEIMSPKISGASAESGAEVFKLKYFDTEAVLSQSPQFYKQMAMASGFNKVFEIGPAFRAEESHTSYHATEINMIDVEVSWLNNVDELMDIEEEWVKSFINAVSLKHKEEIKKHFNVEVNEINYKIPRITFKEAKQLLKDNYNYIGQKEDDLERKEEELLCLYAKKNYGSDFIFVTRFYKEARPFYHQLDEEGLTKSYDLLYKGLEITTGAIREHRYDILISQIKEKNINPEELKFYIEFFKYGCPPHGGFGVGLARIMMKLLEIESIREVMYIYRGPNRLNP